MKSSATAAAATPVRPLLIAKKTSDYHREKLKKVASGPGIAPPSEELISRLNGIGREYPFCVYFREKRYDPL